MDRYFDLIVFAVIAVALLWRLRSVFGERSEGEAPGAPVPMPSAEDQAVMQQLIEAAQARSANWNTQLPNFDVVSTATVHHRLVPFVAVDPSFRPDEFLEKAKKAFTMIIAAFAKADRKTLGFLLSPELYAAFNAQIDKREQNGETYESVVHNVKQAVISDADLDGTVAHVTVDFVAEQTITHKSKDGLYIEHHDGRKQINKDRWTFTKDLKDSGPVWLLTKIEDLDD